MENINNTDNINQKGEDNGNKPEFMGNAQNGQENVNDNLREEEQENADNNKKMWNGVDLNTFTVDKLKEELKNRKIDFPKNAKKKDLQDLLINSK